MPRLKELSLDRDWLSFKLQKDYGGEYDTMVSDGWSKWASATNLERLLMAESLANSLHGYIHKPFQSRQKGETGRDKQPLRFVIKPNSDTAGSCHDAYPGTSGPMTKWPATTHPALLAAKSGTWHVQWQAGNMQRKPLSWDTWSEAAKIVSGRIRGSDAWAAKYASQRKEREAKKKKELEQQAVARAQEIAAARREGAEQEALALMAQVRAAQSAMSARGLLQIMRSCRRCRDR